MEQIELTQEQKRLAKDIADAYKSLHNCVVVVAIYYAAVGLIREKLGIKPPVNKEGLLDRALHRYMIRTREKMLRARANAVSSVYSPLIDPNEFMEFERQTLFNEPGKYNNKSPLTK